MPSSPSKVSSRKEIWSATPTPFLSDYSLDLPAIERLVEHHVALGVSGLMLSGTCGEGPWMPRDLINELVRHTVKASGGRLKIAVQITDNSSLQMLRHIEAVAEAGADYAVTAAPSFFINATPERLVTHYQETIRKSALPMGFYERGKHGAHALPIEALDDVISEPNLYLIKDSSCDPARQAAFVKMAAQRPELRVLTGDEFQCVSNLVAGFDGALLGGAIFNAKIAHEIVSALEQGCLEKAEALQKRMNQLMYDIYGGEKIECWMTGLKYLLVGMGLFSTTTSFLGYPLTEECRAAIDRILTGDDPEGYRADLFPYQK